MKISTIRIIIYSLKNYYYKMLYAYVLKLTKKNSPDKYYIGSSKNVINRVQQHMEGGDLSFYWI